MLQPQGYPRLVRKPVYGWGMTTTTQDEGIKLASFNRQTRRAQSNVVPLEKAVVIRIRKHLIEAGAFVFKTSEGGLPDLIACYKGVFMGFEVKRPDPNKRHPVSALQKQKLTQIRNAGGIGLVVRHIEEVQRCLDLVDTYGPEGVARVTDWPELV